MPRPDGLLLVSIGDYDTLLADKPVCNSEHVQDRPAQRGRGRPVSQPPRFGRLFFLCASELAGDGRLHYRNVTHRAVPGPRRQQK